MICNNQTDSDDCRMFFNASLSRMSNNYFKLTPATNSSNSVYLI
jgi:hypothetical protein